MEEKKKKMSSLDATLMGIGEIIGAGIFSMTGVAIGVAGPGTLLPTYWQVCVQ